MGAWLQPVEPALAGDAVVVDPEHRHFRDATLESAGEVRVQGDAGRGLPNLAHHIRFEDLEAVTLGHDSKGGEDLVEDDDVVVLDLDALGQFLMLLALRVPEPMLDAPEPDTAGAWLSFGATAAERFDASRLVLQSISGLQAASMIAS